MLGTSRPLLTPLPFFTPPGSDGTQPGDREPQSTDPSPTGRIMPCMSYGRGGGEKPRFAASGHESSPTLTVEAMNNLTLGGANWQQCPPGYVFLPEPVPPAMQSLEAHVGGLDLDVTDAKSKLEERQSFESDSSRWSHATTKLEDDNGVEEDNGGVGEDNGEVEEEASNEQSVNGSPSNPHEQRAPLASPRWCVTPEQRKKLEAFLEQVPLPSLAACQLLAVKMGVSPQQIEDWFSDRRRLLAAQEGLGQEGHSALAGHSTAVRATVREEQRRKRVSGERVPRVPSLGTLQQSGRSYGDWEAMDVSQAE